jgi:hypothetical protein
MRPRGIEPGRILCGSTFTSGILTIKHQPIVSEVPTASRTRTSAWFDDQMDADAIVIGAGLAGPV